MFDAEKHNQYVSELREAQINVFLIYNVVAIVLGIGVLIFIFSLIF